MKQHPLTRIGPSRREPETLMKQHPLDLHRTIADRPLSIRMTSGANPINECPGYNHPICKPVGRASCVVVYPWPHCARGNRVGYLQTMPPLQPYSRPQPEGAGSTRPLFEKSWPTRSMLPALHRAASRFGLSGRGGRLLLKKLEVSLDQLLILGGVAGLQRAEEIPS